ncbi:hypothetical protein E2C01_031973 [Portunus trituberculatus]|uniref:Uncharacterized protein n=1 Tax=Portunus trituberculatus TaxID=210409 RepID=A0A5B7EZB4_PORTR|nr:hypothetical protein [Portunus trituberculatus]
MDLSSGEQHSSARLDGRATLCCEVTVAFINSCVGKGGCARHKNQEVLSLYDPQLIGHCSRSSNIRTAVALPYFRLGDAS